MPPALPLRGAVPGTGSGSAASLCFLTTEEVTLSLPARWGWGSGSDPSSKRRGSVAISQRTGGVNFIRDDVSLLNETRGREKRAR